MAGMTNSATQTEPAPFRMDTTSGGTSSTISSPLSSAPNSPIWPCPEEPLGGFDDSSDDSSDLGTAGISHLRVSQGPSYGEFMVALRALNEREGTLITSNEFQTALSLIDDRYGVEMSAIDVLGLGPAPGHDSGVESIQKFHEPTGFSEDDCRAELVSLNQRAQTNLSLEDLNVVLNLVNDLFDKVIAASDVLEWLHQRMKNTGRTKMDEARSNVEAALAFLGVTHSSEVMMSNVQDALAVLDLKVSGAQVMTILMRMDGE